MFLSILFKFASVVLNSKLLSAFSIYILLGVISPLFESLVYISILSYFTKTSLDNTIYYFKYLDLNLLSISIIIILALLFKSIVMLFDALMPAILRRKIQYLCLSKLFHSSFGAVMKFRHGDLLNLLTVECTLSAKVIYSSFNLLFNLLSILLISFLLIKISFQYAFILFLIMFPVLVISKYLLKIQSRISKFSSDLRGVYASDISDSLHGLSKILLARDPIHHLDRTNKNQNLLTNSEIYSNLPTLFFSNINLIVLLILFLFLYKYGDSHNLDVLLLASVGVLGLRLVNYFSSFINSIGTIHRLSGSVLNIFPIFSLANKKFKSYISDVVSISIKDVTYCYQNHNLYYSDISFGIGKINLVSGKSGSGKSTLLYLISGLYDVDKGNILFHTRSGSVFSSANHTVEVCLVQQDIHLFHGSVREYLCGGLKISDERLFSVLSYVDAYDFVFEKGGVDAFISDGGNNFSGGQKRRLEIANAILSGAKVLLFDESCSGLDSENRAIFIAYLEKLSKQYIVIMVEHNLQINNVNLIHIN